MQHEATTSLAGPGVIERAKLFFSERVPQNGAFLEQSGPTWAVFRGQGGEEISLAVLSAGNGTRVKVSTLFFDQAVDRFLSTLPAAAT
jgi:hypothetical protein